MPDFAQIRHRMVEHQLERRGIRDARVLEAARSVPRELFVTETMADVAYEDCPLPIAAGQTISQPYVVALMVEAAALSREDRVLEIGTGSGYAAAVLARVAKQVYTVERHAELGEAARARLAELGFDSVEVRIGDGTLGWPEAAPFDAILVSAGGPAVPDTLRRHLKPGGRLIMPVGGRNGDQRLVRVRRIGDLSYDEQDLGAVAFVPLIGKEGFDRDVETTAGQPSPWHRPV